METLVSRNYTLEKLLKYTFSFFLYQKKKFIKSKSEATVGLKYGVFVCASISVSVCVCVCLPVCRRVCESLCVCVLTWGGQTERQAAGRPTGRLLSLAHFIYLKF